MQSLSPPPGLPLVERSGLVAGTDARFHSYRIRYPKFEGGYSRPLEFKVLDGEDVVAALLYHPPSDHLVFVQQFRPAALPAFKGDESAEVRGMLWPLEIVAGTLEPSRQPEAMIREEISEETGCEVEKLVFSHRYFVNPASSTAQVHLFYAEVSALPDRRAYGNEDEAEDIRVVSIPSSEAVQMALEGGFRNSLTLIALLDFGLKRLSRPR